MFCVYCGESIVNNKCCKCGTNFEKKKAFSVIITPKRFVEQYYCFNCGKNVLVWSDCRPEEYTGGCCKCNKPFRINEQSIGDVLFV